MIKNTVIIVLIFIIMYQLTGYCQIDTLALNKLIKESRDSHSGGLAVWHNDSLYTETYFGKQPQLINCHSVQKSIVGLAIGKLITDNKIDSVETPISAYYPEWKQGDKKKVTIEHIVSHTSGIEENHDPDEWNAPNKVQLALCSNISEPPGTQFRYNTKATYILHDLVKRVSGIRLDLYVAKEIFEPLQIKTYRWEYDSAGNPVSLMISAGELIKIGKLILKKGKIDNTQLVSEEWIKQSVSASQEHKPVYGFMWWLIPEKTEITIDKNIITHIKDKGVNKDFIKKYSQLKGVYNGWDTFKVKVSEVFGHDWYKQFQKDLYPFANNTIKLEYSDKIIGYKAMGMHGQYIIIYPEKNLIAARMIKDSDKHDKKTTELIHFEKLVYELVK